MIKFEPSLAERSNTLRRGVFFLSLSFILGLLSCNTFEPSGPVPAYIHIPEFQLEVKNDNSQGSDAIDVPDAWVYVGNELVGVFEVPITIPILEFGEQKITIFAGIKKNGLANNRVSYPFYTAFIDTFNLVAEKVDTIVPIIKYFDALKFPFIEDFEDNSISFTKSGVDATVDSMYITKVDSLVYAYDGDKNEGSGAVDIPLGRQIFQNSSIASLDLPRSDDVYLELNYKTDVPLQTGLVATKNGRVIPIVLLFPTDGVWKKAYISLAEDINNNIYDGSEFKVLFDALSSTDTNQVNHIYLDNIKVVHR